MSFIRLSVELLISLEFEGLFLFIKSGLSRVSAGWCNRIISRLAKRDWSFFFFDRECMIWLSQILSKCFSS